MLISCDWKLHLWSVSYPEDDKTVLKYPLSPKTPSGGKVFISLVKCHVMRHEFHVTVCDKMFEKEQVYLLFRLAVMTIFILFQKQMKMLFLKYFLFVASVLLVQIYEIQTSSTCECGSDMCCSGGKGKWFKLKHPQHFNTFNSNYPSWVSTISCLYNIHFRHFWLLLQWSIWITLYSCLYLVSCIYGF